jgi:hypothetical protein
MTFLRWGSLIVLSTWLTLGCGSDINWPDVISVEAWQGDAQVELLELSEVNEDAFIGDIPVDVFFLINFDETMDLTTAEENIWIEDAARTQFDVTLTARLAVITVTPNAPLQAGQNHTLHIGDDIADIAGHELLNGYDISFYTAP